MNNISMINRNKVNIRWERKRKEYIKNLEKKNTTEDLERKARILGNICGDGSIMKRKNRFDIAFYPDDEEMMNKFIDDFEYFYLKKPRCKKEEHHFIIRITHQFAAKDLLSISKFGTLDWEIPKFIFEDKNYLKEWLKAFFDCEANVGRRQIQLQTVNEKGLKQIQKALETFNIESKIYKYVRKNENWNDNYILSIMKKDSRLRYLNEIGFNHSKKREKLKKLLNGRIA